MNEMAYSEFDDSLASRTIARKILSLFTRGLNTADIQRLLGGSCAADLLRSLLSTTADSVLGDFHAWQESALDHVYPVVYLDSMAVKFRVGRDHRNYSVLIALGIGMHGHKCPLGLWVSEVENKQAWQMALSDLKRRGVNDVLVACVYGQPGARDGLAKVFPRTQTLLCIVRLIEHSLNFVAWKDRKAAAAGLRGVYEAANIDLAADALMHFMYEWDPRYAGVAQLWRSHWQELEPLLAQPPLWRHAIVSTAAIQSLHQALRKVTLRHGVFTDENTLLVRLYLAQHHLARRWGSPLRQWKHVLNELTVCYGERVPYDF